MPLLSPEAKDGVAAVDRALSVLGAIGRNAEPSTLAEIARATDLYKSTILRLMASLEASGFVVRQHDGRYGLGGAAFRLGLAYERQNPLRRNVLPVLNDLVARGCESASFHVPHGPGVRLCLFRVNSRHSTLDRVEAGDILPLDRGAAGRVLLAYLNPDDVAHAHVRRDACAVSIGERDPDCAGMAAPVFGPDNTIIGALSLSGPGERFTRQSIARMKIQLIPAAAALTQTLGGDPQGRK